MAVKFKIGDPNHAGVDQYSPIVTDSAGNATFPLNVGINGGLTVAGGANVSGGSSSISGLTAISGTNNIISPSLVSGVSTSAGAGDVGKIAKLDATGKLDSSFIPTATGAFTEAFTSAEQVITLAGLLTIAHGLTAAPTLIQLRLINKVGELGFNVNDEVIRSVNAEANESYGFSVVPDATNIVIRLGDGTLQINHKTTGVCTPLTSASWKIIVKAWK